MRAEYDDQTEDEIRAAIYAELEWIRHERGYKAGWTKAQFKEIFGVWPELWLQSLTPQEPRPELVKLIKRKVSQFKRGKSVTAWQKKIRDKRAAEDADADLFGQWWTGLDLTLSKSEVREIDHVTAKTIIEKYEWLGTMGAFNLHRYGIYFDGSLGGAVVYSVEYIENLGKWDNYGYTGKIILLSRGACAHWTPKGSASRLIRRSMDLLPKRYEVVTATVDDEAGEIGTIYQACGFHYVGQLSQGGPVASASINGRRVGARQLKNLFGTRGHLSVDGIEGVEDIRAHARKKRYFAFRGSKVVKRTHTAAIAHLIKPYPKREDDGEREGAVETVSGVTRQAKHDARSTERSDGSA